MTDAAIDSTSGHESNGTSVSGVHQRRPQWVSSWEAMQKFAAAFSDAGLKIRKEDKVTAIGLIISATCATAIFLFPQQAAPIGGVFDVVFAVTILGYMMQRLGIIIMLTERQTLFVGELMIAMFVAGMFVAINMNIVLSSFRDAVTAVLTIR
jgi:hypothetical protein